MDILTLFFRTVLMYFVVFLIMRLMGKREIGKLSIFDLVISIMIAEIAVFVIDDVKKPLVDGLVPIITLVLIQILMAYLTLGSQKFRSMVDGKPSIIIDKGKIDREEMRKQRYNLDDLMLQLRENKITNVADVEFALLEPTGKLTIVKKDFRELAEMQGRDTRIRYEGLPLPLIMDGKVQDLNLEKIGKTRFWLKNEIQQKGVSDFKEVFFCSIDHKGRLFLDKMRHK